MEAIATILVIIFLVNGLAYSLCEKSGTKNETL